MRFPQLSKAARPLTQGLRAQTLRRAGLTRPQTPLLYTSIRKQHAAAVATSSDSFLQGSSASYVEEMHEAWLRDPSSVHISWQIYFKNLAKGAKPTDAFQAPPTISNASASTFQLTEVPQSEAASSDISEHLKIQLMVRAYQVRGHHIANLDPLGILHADLDSSIPPELNPSHYGFTEADMDKVFSLGPGILPSFATEKPSMTLREIISHLKSIYCGSIGIEYSHIPDRAQCDWIRQRVETPNRYKFSLEEKRMILDRLIWSDSFERFVANKYKSQKRFGLEGCEALIPWYEDLDRSLSRQWSFERVKQRQFSGSMEPSVEGSGDVKYHLGMNYVRPTPSGKRVHLSLVANPSHLEAVNPVVLGKTRALQHYSNDKEKSRSLALLLHGDAAFAAQGIVYETLGFAELPNYSVGGTVHIVVNNQVGFTTDPRFARSTPYCTDIAKAINVPIFHVNGDDVEAVTYVCQMAADWRQTFKKDCVIDIVCYRRHGHNETDQPSFTQPRMYKHIAKASTRVGSIHRSASRQGNPPTYPTGASIDSLRKVGAVISSYPPDFEVHPNLKKILKTKKKTIEEEKGIDWATAEALAWGTLLLEGNHVRLGGQDVERGTFSQRHAVLHDQNNENQYVPLAHIAPTQPAFSICNSSLSEYGALGFELGYSFVNPNSLVMWEGQFGDFANTAQCIIDQFISSGEKKWLQRSGLAMLLPHGYDGQGPEHSSARIERFLQLCDENPYYFPTPEKLARQHQDCNMQVVYPTTPANYFHVLRRQVYRGFRKPLIVFTSKSLLRHPLARSSFDEMIGDTKFRRYIPEAHSDLVEPEQVKTHVLCSGQVYYALLKARDQNGIKDVAISRVEQLNPFPFDLVRDHLDKYPNAQVVWAQEEPLNAGGWFHIEPRLRTVLAQTQHHQGKAIRYAGREPGAATATGNKKQHLIEEWSLLSNALLGKTEKPKEIVAGVPLWN
ncbi:oxoglutarate dehydrogenase, E1 component [Basidiobolus meristosporus CBS 931.73]|uniref:2-oxoglutarate dehydrogenase, mitochondrial n=1 Tax=Basidiobolus meristosporus CBS 931.73 TaxID=1314790 RepID=A0A1Y1YNX3_9FUNG|nr:oxoglutarate dehydrogenase, E1 component [Basidiobolus meristosporus CBS 931.73]|eukprot:ORX99711.1 oxoglutarate dehydrogenase, E1 component [Basidiobolus meristosporus CBS 931.73]